MSEEGAFAGRHAGCRVNEKLYRTKIEELGAQVLAWQLEVDRQAKVIKRLKALVPHKRNCVGWSMPCDGPFDCNCNRDKRIEEACK